MRVWRVSLNLHRIDSEGVTPITYDYAKDYIESSPIPKITDSCLMARSSKVFVTPPSLSSVLDDIESDHDSDSDSDEFCEEYIKEMYAIMKSLPPIAHARVKQLMELVSSRDEAIDNLESHIDDEKQIFNLLEQDL